MAFPDFSRSPVRSLESLSSMIWRPLASILVAAITCHAGNPDPAAINLPELKSTPIIDGNLATGEWDSASGAPVSLNSSGTLSSPSGRFQIGHKADRLYFVMVVSDLPQMPRSQATQRDGEVWRDDAFEMLIKAPSGVLQLIVNAEGTIYDSRNGDKSWNGSWSLAVSKIGKEQSILEGTVPRGFIVEGSLPMSPIDITSLAAPADWGLQVALHTGADNILTWNHRPEGALLASMGILKAGGQAQRLDGVRSLKEGRLLKVSGDFSLQTLIAGVSERADIKPRKVAPPGPFALELPLKGGQVYRMEISNSQFRWGFLQRAASAVPVVAVPNPSRNAFFVYVDPYRADEENQAPFRVSFEQGEKVLWSRDFDLQEMPRPESYRVDYSAWSGTDVDFVLTRKAEPDKKHVLERLRIPQALPQWATFTMPENAPAIPAPFTSLVAEDREVRLFGDKVVKLGGSPFVDAVSVNGKNLLSAPVTLQAMQNGGTVDWHLISSRLIESSPEKAIYQTRAESGDIVLEVTTEIGFDGMIFFAIEMSKKTDSDVELSDVEFRVPLNGEIAKLFSQYVLEDFVFARTETWNEAGAVPPNGLSMRFTPSLWVGNPERGIEWFAESRAGWTGDETPLEIRPSNDTFEIVARLAQGERKLDKPLRFEMGLMPTPTRPRLSKSDLQAQRIAVLTSLEQLVNVRPPHDRGPAVIIPAIPESMGSPLRYELDVRFDEAAFESREPINVISHQNTLGAQIHLRFLPEKSVFQVFQVSPAIGQCLLFESKANVERGKWHRLVFDVARTTNLAFDGKEIGGGDLVAPIPAYQRDAHHKIGGSGGLSLARWSLLRIPESAGNQDKAPAPLGTVHRSDLSADPTILKMAQPREGNLSTPAYLEGDWRYDAGSQSLVSGAVSPAEPYAKTLSCMGVTGVMVSEWSRLMEGHGGPANPRLFWEVAELCNSLGIRLIPYTPHGITSDTPGYEDFKWEFSDRTPFEEPRPWWVEGDKGLFDTETSGTIRNRNLNAAAEIMALGGGGVYLDGGTYPNATTNPMLSEMEFDPVTNRPVRKFTILAKRAYMIDLARLLQTYRKDFLIDAHCSVGFTPVTMSQVTDATNGESLGVRPDWRPYVSPDFVAADYMGTQYGFNTDTLFFPNSPVPVERGITIMQLHGATPRLGWGISQARAEGIWSLADKFDTTTAQWMPYWNPESAFRPEAREVLVSAYVHPGQRALVFASNYSENENASGKIHVDWAKLSMEGPATVRLLNTGETLEVSADGSIDLPLSPYWCSYLWIEPVHENGKKPSDADSPQDNAESEQGINPS